MKIDLQYEALKAVVRAKGIRPVDLDWNLPENDIIETENAVDVEDLTVETFHSNRESNGTSWYGTITSRRLPGYFWRVSHKAGQDIKVQEFVLVDNTIIQAPALIDA